MFINVFMINQKLPAGLCTSKMSLDSEGVVKIL